ncbi:hypothetical protein DPMN_043834 [Dreissena polymorpha]|uniref:Uncharacterized protein n=1 Tax=Dreissena polymorpha TaxID=45954 RepID=A0A9D4D178_DREPO|nr:hypothetical protein DPMN_043834 [Dreissena polymorpha]
MFGLQVLNTCHVMSHANSCKSVRGLIVAELVSVTNHLGVHEAKSARTDAMDPHWRSETCINNTVVSLLCATVHGS